MDRRLVFNSTYIGSAIGCRNPKCRAFNPVLFGFQPQVSPKAHLFWKQYLESTREEADQVGRSNDDNRRR